MKYLILFLVIFPAYFFSQSIPTEKVDKRMEILKNAEEYLGLKYRSKVGKHIFDCSGFVRFLMAEIGENITRSSVTQIHDGKRITDIKNAKPGDIIVFKGRNFRNNRPGHVALVHHWSNDTLYFIHASVSKGIKFDKITDPYYAKRILQIRDVLSH